MPTLRDIVIKQANKQSKLVDTLTEEAPIISGMEFEASTHGLQNVYEKIISISHADIADLDAPLQTVDMETSLERASLSVIGGIMEVGEDRAVQMGGPGPYFARKMPSILRETGNQAEMSIFYNNLRAFAFANSKLVDATGQNSANYSIIAIKWSPGEMTGLYDKNGLGKGMVFDITPLSNGAVYKDSNGRLVYGQRMKSYIGIQLANPRYIAGIVNNDISADAPSGTRRFATAKMIDDMLADCRANPANTVIYCHPKVKSYIGTIYKLDKLNLVNADNQVNTVVDAWNGIPIVPSYNLLDGAEAKVTIS